MNAKEFSDWYADHCAAFPETAAFVNSAKAAKQTLEHWLRVLADAAFDHAMLATHLLLSGKEPEIPAYDRSSIPRRVAEICQRLEARDKLHQLPPEPASTAPRKSRLGVDATSSRAICEQLIAVSQAKGDVDAMSRKLIPIDPESEPRYKCMMCCDRGMVRVWDPASMLLAAHGELTRAHGCYSCCIRCSCISGNRYEAMSFGYWNEQLKKYNRETPIVYDPEKWCLCDGCSQADIDRLCDFMAAYQQQTPSKPVQSFERK